MKRDSARFDISTVWKVLGRVKHCGCKILEAVLEDSYHCLDGMKYPEPTLRVVKRQVPRRLLSCSVCEGKPGHVAWTFYSNIGNVHIVCRSCYDLSLLCAYDCDYDGKGEDNSKEKEEDAAGAEQETAPSRAQLPSDAKE